MFKFINSLKPKIFKSIDLLRYKILILIVLFSLMSIPNGFSQDGPILMKWDGKMPSSNSLFYSISKTFGILFLAGLAYIASTKPGRSTDGSANLLGLAILLVVFALSQAQPLLQALQVILSTAAIIGLVLFVAFIVIMYLVRLFKK